MTPFFSTEVRATSGEGEYKGTSVRGNKWQKCPWEQTEITWGCKGTDGRSSLLLDKGDKKACLKAKHLGRLRN
jgi:hypothetical protein